MTVGATTIVVGGIFNFFLIQTVKFNVGWLVSIGHLISSLCLLFIAYALTTSQMYHFSEMVSERDRLLGNDLYSLGSVRWDADYVPANTDAVSSPQRIFCLGCSLHYDGALFHPLRYRVQNVVDQLLFTKRYDQMQHLRTLTRRILSSMDRDELLNALFNNLKSIGFSSVSLLLKDPQKPIFQIKNKWAFNPKRMVSFLSRIPS